MWYVHNDYKLPVGPTDKTIAYNVLKKNQTKIISSDVSVFKLAADLWSRDVISEALYQCAIDRHTGLSTTERLVQLVSSVINAVKVNGGEWFDKLVQSLRECGQERLADELCQCYSKCNKLCIIHSNVQYTHTSCSPALTYLKLIIGGAGRGREHAHSSIQYVMCLYITGLEEVSSSSLNVPETREEVSVV